jgi:glycosyltransferase involved in cell wall biosynthesis
MIVKDEEKVLKRCLDSINKIADEVIIVDTGSIDKTKEISLKYTNLVYEYIWNDDFSKARNFAASKATGEWIMVIDADEYVDRKTFSDFKNNLKANPPSLNIMAVQIVNFVGAKGKDTVLNYHERLYKNNGKISYYRNIHEMLIHDQALENKGLSNLQIFHSGYMEDVVRDKAKSRRNLNLLTNKNKKEAIDYYFLGNEYFQLGDLEKAIDNYKIGYQLKEDINYDWVKKLLVRLISCLHAANRNSEALGVINACEGVFTNLVDFKFFKGKIYSAEGRTTEAIITFKEILLQKDSLTADSSNDYLEYLPNKYLGELYEKENKLHLSVQHYSQTLSINDSDDFVWVKLISILVNNSSLDELIIFINNNCLKRSTMSIPRLVKILLNVSHEDAKKLAKVYLNEFQLSIENN